jgi:phosphate starvation-inducible PhoH-like protein
MKVLFLNNRLVPVLFGEQNQNLKKIEQELGVQIDSRGNEVFINGTAKGTDFAKEILEALWIKLQQGEDVDIKTVESALRFQKDSSKNNKESNLENFTEQHSNINTKKTQIKPRTPNQKKYIDSMQRNRLVFGLGPAGTGKTYLAIAQAVACIENGLVERLILSRPAVEAGEHLGYLPGEMKEKMDPYMRPLYDALQDTMYIDKLQKRLATDEIEIAPLAYMRGRTLNNSFIILDEAQNTSAMQMKMFLTRLGENSFMVVTGDPSQTDLSPGVESGLIDAQNTLSGVDGIEFIRFTSKDVVRSSLVTKIIQAYDAKFKKT